MSITWGALGCAVASVVLLVAGVAKLRESAAFVVAVRAALPARLTPYTRRVVPAVIGAELLAGSALLVPPFRPAAALLAAVLLAAFAGVAARSATGARPVHCACFGTSSVRLGWFHVTRNVALAGLVAASPWLRTPVDAGLLPAAAITAGLLAAAAVSGDRLLALVHPSTDTVEART